MTASPDWAELRRLAEAATPTEGATLNRYEHGGGRLLIDRTQEGGGRQLIADFYGDGADREYYAAANPATILALLDERAALIAEAARLREALRPFAAEADRWHEMGDTRPIRTDTDITVGDLRRARALPGGDHG